MIAPEADVRVFQSEGNWICEVTITARDYRHIRRSPELVSWWPSTGNTGYRKTSAVGNEDMLVLRPNESFIKRIVLAGKEKPLPPGQYHLSVSYSPTPSTPALLLERDFQVPPNQEP